MDFKVNDIVVDFTATFGKNFTLVDIIQKPVYKDGSLFRQETKTS